ncbi:MAG: hypothetical protein ACM3JG_14880 [Thiohalocapsa sp.]
MRWTKGALGIFGLGMVLGLVVVAGEFTAWERAASAVMALGLVLTPVGLFADGQGMALLRWLLARLSRRRPARKRAKPRTAQPRHRKSARAASRAPARTRR